jgi:ribonuclease BN (tRNA processing enzyme)
MPNDAPTTTSTQRSPETLHLRPRSFLALFTLLGAGAQAAASQAVPPPTGHTEVVLLGTGTPYPDPARQGPATAVVVDGRTFLFDAGTGVMRQLNAAGLPINGVEALFVTHLHSDHTLGYPDLILTSWLMRRRSTLQAYGPPGLQQMTDHLLAAWQDDIEVRVEGLERELPDAYQVSVHEIGPGLVYDSAGVRVRAFPVLHGNWAHAFGYRIETPDRVIVISGDTRPSQTVIEASRGVDVLVHEAYPAERVAPEDRPGGEFWPQYLKKSHTSAFELGQIAAEARPKLLVITHVVSREGAAQEILAAVRRGGYEGRVVIGEDLGRY